MSQHILYCNENADILLLDLPASIARAQLSVQRLRSTPALSTPYVSPEPKGAKRDALLSAIPAEESEYRNQIQKVVSDALKFLHGEWHETTWCHPRVKLEDDELTGKSECLNHSGELATNKTPPPLVLSSSLNSVCCATAFINTVVYNSHSASTVLAVSNIGRFIIPAQSVFLSATVEGGKEAFEEAVQVLLPARCFDLVLLDPPWSNRSVRNSRVYRTAEHQRSDPFGQILPLISTYLSKNSYLAVWIINKAAVRSMVLSTCHSYGFALEEEWIWLKITEKGEPVLPLNGVWRKPYEILLLFRRTDEQREVVRRVGLAVPDVHSRKPSLKSMFEQLLPKQYNALEVFARSLTAGWWSWGDEVLKFQHERQWM